MSEYHKIKTVWKRDPDNKHKTLLDGQWAIPEFGYLQDNEWTFTEKVDGTNIRVYFENGKVRYSGRTDNAQIPAFLVERLNERFLSQVDRISNLLDDGICLYGEGYGAKIQKGGGNYRDDQDFVLFDVNVGGWWLERHNVEDVAVKLGLDVVPILGYGTLHDMVATAENGFESEWGNFVAEGIVARPSTELRTRSGHRVITKIKYKDFER